VPFDHPRYTPPKVAPAEHALSTFDLLRTVVRNPLEAIPSAAYHEPLVEVSRSSRRPIFHVVAPDLVETVLVREHDRFPKSIIDDRLFRPLFRDGLLSARGDAWRWKRRTVAPAFRQKSIHHYLPAIEAAFGHLCRRWEQTPGPQNVNAAMAATTLEAVCAAMFSGFGELDGRALSDAIGRYLAPVPWVVAYGALGLPGFMPHPGKIRMARAAADARERVRQFLQVRKAGEPRSDLAQVLMEAVDPETGRRLADEDLVDMFLTLLAAGHETSATGLSWALFCLAEQPELQDALAMEVGKVLVEGTIAPEHIDRLGSVEQFIKEVMRLFPPAPLMSRRATNECELGGRSLRKGAVLFIPIYAIHRHEALWDDPDDFDPTRFAPELERARHRCAYMPFGAGPRICIGASFAMLEMVAALALLLRRFQFSRAEGATSPKPVDHITLRAEPEIILRIARR
jgi:cytochrome P450